jgi:hypothetical protein
MPITLPVKDIPSTEPPAVPLPVCMGPPTRLWLETINTNEDVQNFWRGYAIGGAVCDVLLVVELVVIIVLL